MNFGVKEASIKVQKYILNNNCVTLIHDNDILKSLCALRSPTTTFSTRAPLDLRPCGW